MVSTTTAYRTQMSLMGCYQSGHRYRKTPRKSADSRHFRHFGTDSHCIKDCVLIDPCCGSGGMFVQSARFVEQHSGNISNISIYGQDSNPTTWKMAADESCHPWILNRILVHMRQTLFLDDRHPTLRADYIMANPPFNLSDWGADKLKEDVRWQYGMPPAGNANFA